MAAKLGRCTNLAGPFCGYGKGPTRSRLVRIDWGTIRETFPVRGHYGGQMSRADVSSSPAVIRLMSDSAKADIALMRLTDTRCISRAPKARQAPGE